MSVNFQTCLEGDRPVERFSSLFSVCGSASRRLCLVGAASTLLAAGPLHAADAGVDIGPAAAQTRVPRWDARGLGQPPWQGAACLDESDDGRFLAVGTISPPGDPNLFLLDGNGKVLGQHRAGHQGMNEVHVSDDGRLAAALSTTPEGTAGDTPRVFAFRQGKELIEAGARLRFRDFRPAGFLFHYGDHSNHLPRIAGRARAGCAIAGDDLLYWLSSDGFEPTEQAHLGHGVTTAMAASASGTVVVGRFGGAAKTPAKYQNVLVLKPGSPKPVWSRPVSTDMASSPKLEKGVYGPPAPPYDEVRFEVPLSAAIDAAGKRIAVADYEGWQRVFHPRDGGEDVVFGTRVMPSRPTIHVYDAEGKTLCRIAPDAFGEAFWAEMTFSGDGRKLFVWPHQWTSRGLGGMPFLPADEGTRTLYVVDVPGNVDDKLEAFFPGNGKLETGTTAHGKLETCPTAVRFPDAISSVAVGGDRIAVGCWDHKVYLLDKGLRPIPGLANGLDAGAASLVAVSKDGKRITMATTAGMVRALDSDGKELWQTDLNKAAQPGEKRWTKNQKADKLGPGIWRTNGGLAHSDMGSQILIEAPQGLILIDPNSAASFEQNWARIAGAGLDPGQVKYVLPTHEHGDHAPGASLWRVVTGAQVVATAEMAYILQHHIPGGTGYGFHAPVATDVVLTEDKELDLAGLKVKAIRLPGHTSGSMGYVFQKEGKTYVATGDLIMPGGVLGYSGSLDFSALDVLNSLKKLAALGPDVVLGGHGGGPPDNFIAAGIEAGEATGWSRMPPPKPNPLYRFSQTNYLVAAWLEPIVSAAYGDVDGDGRPDVAVLVPKGRGSAVKIYLNRGGKFPESPDATVDLPDLAHPSKVRLVQLGKGKAADFFVSGEGQSVVLCQQGRLQYKTAMLPVTRGSQVATGDFNGDGKTDLVIGARFVPGYYVACQRDDGAFTVRQAKAPAQMYLDIALADVDGDRREDLLTSNGDVFLRHPDGSLSDTPDLHLAPPTGEPAGWTFMAAADFDRDGSTDVALLTNGKEGVTVWLYRNTRNARAPFAKEPSAKFLVPEVDVCRDGPTVADGTNDGIADLILCKRDKQPGVCVLTGATADGLSAQRVVHVKLDYVPHFDARFGIADFKGDGRPGLAGFGRSPTGAMGVYIWLQP
jgi:glyoxylase-like metal-dependent hydrolase (beta-lactamase superfamily II)/outer membrane protein assembly factor BamB